jgi:hypothetical protein
MPSTLTPMESQHLTELHTRFVSGTFSESDVSALMMLLREKSSGGPILELANSIAHVERNSGEFFKRIRDNQSLVNDLGKRSGIIEGRDIFDAPAFTKNLNTTLDKLRFEALNESVAELIFLCCLSLLQNSGFRGGKTFGELRLVLTSDRFNLEALMPVEAQGKRISMALTVTGAPNRWLPVCNPRASIGATQPVLVKVQNFRPLIEGFKPFEVYIERAPPISESDVAALVVGLPVLTRTRTGVVFAPLSRLPMSLRHDGERLIVEGVPDFFRAGSQHEQVLKLIRLMLRACVHDDSGAHWFLEGLAIAPDGFHNHWVGRGSPTCTRPA